MVVCGGCRQWTARVLDRAALLALSAVVHPPSHSVHPPSRQDWQPAVLDWVAGGGRYHRTGQLSSAWDRKETGAHVGRVWRRTTAVDGERVRDMMVAVLEVVVIVMSHARVVCRLHRREQLQLPREIEMCRILLEMCCGLFRVLQIDGHVLFFPLGQRCPRFPVPPLFAIPEYHVTWHLPIN